MPPSPSFFVHLPVLQRGASCVRLEEADEGRRREEAQLVCDLLDGQFGSFQITLRLNQRHFIDPTLHGMAGDGFDHRCQVFGRDAEFVCVGRHSPFRPAGVGKEVGGLREYFRGEEAGISPIFRYFARFLNDKEMHTREEQMEAFGRFLDVLDELREKCPWDRKQTNESLRPNTIEETYELCDALVRGDKKGICKELGDVLLHVAFYAKIASETGDFDMKDVCDRLCEKLIYRHPHVFGTVKAETAGQVCENWEQLKLKEKDGNKRVLSGVPAALPSLIKAYRIQDKARNVGFDWEEREQVWDKVKEEIAEFQAEVPAMDPEKAEAEFGDVMFSLVNAARLYGINPDNALERTNQKFIRRFTYVEEHTLRQGKSLKEMTLAEMDALWNEAKRQE